jgi:hypothetical protein
MATKLKYKCVFNYHYQMTVLYCYGFSKAQAKELCFRRLAAQHDVSIQTVRNYFSGDKDNFSIEEEK